MFGKAPLTDELRANFSDIWDGLVNHFFVIELGDGTLSKEVFNAYSDQVYLSLSDWVSLVSSATVKAPELAASSQMAGYQHKLLGSREEFFQQGFRERNMSKADIANLKYAPNTGRHRNHSRKLSKSGGFVELLTTLLASEWPRLEWASQLQDGDKQPEDERYRAWIELHSSHDMKDFVGWLRDSLDRSPDAWSQRSRLQEVFQQVLRHEFQYWETAYHGGTAAEMTEEYREKATQLLEMSREEVESSLTTNGTVAVTAFRNACRKGWLAVVAASDAYFIKKGMSSGSIPTNEIAKRDFVHQNMDPKTRRDFAAFRQTLYVDGYEQGMLRPENMPMYFHEVEQFINQIAFTPIASDVEDRIFRARIEALWDNLDLQDLGPLKTEILGYFDPEFDATESARGEDRAGLLALGQGLEKAAEGLSEASSIVLTATARIPRVD